MLICDRSHSNHCATVEEHPVCPGIRAANYMGRDYYHATFTCYADPCEGEPTCLLGHVEEPSCCTENVDGIPCQALFRDTNGVRVDCDGEVVPCTTSADCSATEWCRATENVALEQHGQAHVRRRCVERVQEDASCGGFSMPWEFERCASGLECVADDVLDPDAPGLCQPADDTPCGDETWVYVPCQSDDDCAGLDGGWNHCSAFKGGCLPSSCVASARHKQSRSPGRTTATA
eukprot:SAG22_NODE_2231_length_2811_cov_1.056416_2_plen_233_part_00